MVAVREAASKGAVAAEGETAPTETAPKTVPTEIAAPIKTVVVPVITALSESLSRDSTPLAVVGVPVVRVVATVG